MTGIERIAAERKRQIEEEGFNALHDGGNNHEEMALAAACYTLPSIYRYMPTEVVDKKGKHDVKLLNRLFVWDKKWWKPTPKSRIRELEKAGALIAAEIDRLLRLEGENESD